jgi:hypothetical protein
MKLVAGDHTRTISVAAPTVGGLMKFAVKTQTCLGCKTPLPKGVFSLCGKISNVQGSKTLCVQIVFPEQANYIKNN